MKLIPKPETLGGYKPIKDNRMDMMSLIPSLLLAGMGVYVLIAAMIRFEVLLQKARLKRIARRLIEGDRLNGVV